MPAKNLFFIFLMCFISSLFSINTEAKSLFNSEGVIEAVNEIITLITPFMLLLYFTLIQPFQKFIGSLRCPMELLMKCLRR